MMSPAAALLLSSLLTVICTNQSWRARRLGRHRRWVSLSPAISSSFDTIVEAGFWVVNLASFFSPLPLSKSPERSNPGDRAMMSNAFRLGTQSEVRHLKVPILIDEEVFRLEIPVVDTTAVTEINCPNQLLEILPCIILFEAPFCNLVEELAAFDIFHHEVDLGLAGHDFIKLHDIWMANEVHHSKYLFPPWNIAQEREDGGTENHASWQVQLGPAETEIKLKRKT
ncbi:hypothetical protein MUK42_22259 [Musa troglodytarum]|uniref:Uncharacterized protein n=1 Tax=Musa troglodytarum TaxID=320322 RepID=A0A9E7I5R0_9LILI|nr:hypothetical protein MUK42_22259 [Musa troglodytarum]